jgi:hypothetical protein
MRGIRVSPASRKLDIVLVAARYQPQDHKLDFAQGYVRRGTVWSDLKLLYRPELVEQVTQGKKVVVGEQFEMPGNYKVEGRVKLTGKNGERCLRVDGGAGSGDDLKLALV